MKPWKDEFFIAYLQVLDMRCKQFPPCNSIRKKIAMAISFSWGSLPLAPDWPQEIPGHRKNPLPQCWTTFPFWNSPNFCLPSCTNQDYQIYLKIKQKFPQLSFPVRCCLNVSSFYSLKLTFLSNILEPLWKWKDSRWMLLPKIYENTAFDILFLFLSQA